MTRTQVLVRSDTATEAVPLPPLARRGGLAALLGGVGWMVAWAVYGSLPVAPAGQQRPGWESFNLAAGVAGALLALGLAAAYLRQGRRAGRLGRAGVMLAWGGALAIGAGRLVQLADLGPGWVLVILGAFLWVVGTILFAVATLRAGVLPRPAAGLLLVGALLLFVVVPEDRRAFLALPYGAAWAWLGGALRTGAGAGRGGPAARR